MRVGWSSVRAAAAATSKKYNKIISGIYMVFILQLSQ